ncbi:ggdef domain containing protein, partial [Vibrio parahaemolyticus EKP-026]
FCGRQQQLDCLHVPV